MRAKLFCNQSILVSAEAVIENMKENLEKYEKHILIIPERYTLEAEKLMLNAFNQKCSFNCEVISINRLCNRVFGINEVLDKQGGTMLIQKILQDKQKDLHFFTSMHSKLGFAENLYQTIMQFKSSGITPEQVMEKSEDLFGYKMKDIAIIFAEYEKYIENGLTDGPYKLGKLLEEIKTNSFFNGKTAFYFAFFESLTYYEASLIKKLIKNNNYCVIGCRYCLGLKNEHIFDNAVYNQIESIFFENGLNDIEQIEFSLPGYFEHIKNNLFAYNPNKVILKNESVKLFEAKNKTDEVRHMLRQIYNLIFNGYRYKDINIAVSNLEEYQAILQKELSNFEFSYYIDYSSSLMQTELGRFFSSIFDCLYYNFMSADVLKLINNYYFALTKEELNFLNVFYARFNLQGYEWLKNVSLQDDRYLEPLIANYPSYDLILQTLYENFEFLKQSFSNCSSALDYVFALRQVCERFEIKKRNEELVQENQEDAFSVKINGQSFEKFIKILEQIENLGITTTLNILNFSQLLKSGLDSCKINLIPLSNDSLFFGDASSSTFEKRKIMIMLGTNYGKNPRIKDDIGLVQDKEIEKLATKYLLEPKVSDINLRSRLKSYELCLNATEKLIVYYAICSDDGEQLKPSQIVNSLTKIFMLDEKTPLQALSTDEDVTLLNSSDTFHLLNFVGNKKSAQTLLLEKINFSENKNISSIYYSLNDKERSLVQNIVKNFCKPLVEGLKDVCFSKKENNNILTSFSQLKDYLYCPYYHFVKRALKIQEIKDVSINQLDIGSLLHRYAELFVKNIIKHQSPFNEKELFTVMEKVDRDVNNEFQKVLKQQNNILISKSVVKEGLKLMIKINNEYKHTSFKPFGCEYKFDSFKICETSSIYNLNGSIDRIDRFENLYSLVDYKTGSAKATYEEIYYGDRIQLLLYAGALKDKLKDCEIAGIGYYPIKDKFKNLETKNDADFLVDGYYINDEDILGKLDNVFCEDRAKIQSTIYNITKTSYKNGNVKFTGKLIDINDFNTLIDYSKKLAKKIILEIERGYIQPKPVKDYKGSCSYCAFAGICNKEIFGKEREKESKSLQDIKEADEKNV